MAGLRGPADYWVSAASDSLLAAVVMSVPMFPAGCRTRRPAPEGSWRRPATGRCTPRGVAFAFVEAANILREDLPLPVCVLRARVLERNLAEFQRFSEAAGVLLCPHAKTTMAPALFRRQLAAGSWGLTFATGAQVRAARAHGVPRIFYANELVGAADIRFVAAELRRDPEFEFFCLADSVAGVRLLADRIAALGPGGPGRPVDVLVEGGLAGARCGVRDVATAVEVAEAIRAAAPHLALAGVEGFEGLARARDGGDREPIVREFLAFLSAIATALDERDLFDRPEVLLTAGGSALFDLVIDVLTRTRLSRPTQVMLRSGCYLSEDWGMYRRALADLHAAHRFVSARPGTGPGGLGPGPVGARAWPAHPVRGPPRLRPGRGQPDRADPRPPGRHRAPLAAGRGLDHGRGQRPARPHGRPPGPRCRRR